MGNNRIKPDWLTRYPGADLRKEFINPFDTVTLPLTMPAIGATTTRYAVPMEGKVTMLQYNHRVGDSPWLIQRHYDALLAEQGFNRVIACATPCPTASGQVYWMKMLDPNTVMDGGAFPWAPTILIGHKDNAMAFVAVGKSVYESSAPYTSFVKIIEGSITDRSDLDAWLASLKRKAPAAPKTPALVAPSAIPVSRAAPFQSNIVEEIAPARLTSAANQTRGRVYILLSSKDSNCPFCVRANPVFAELASQHADEGRFIMTTWEPWPTAFNDAFVKSKGIGGLPAYLVYADGKYIGRVDGNVPKESLEQNLINTPKLPKSYE
jgi:thiol-disulfide isomerase/thioredoxin